MASTIDFYVSLNRPSKEGFDIVIGNPPYIDSETMTNLGLRWERKVLQNKYSNLSGNWDIYMAFFELALFIGDIVSFITPDKWLSKPFGEKFRKNQMCSRVSTITRAGSKVFESATVDSIITLFTKNSKTIHTAWFDNKNTISPITSEYLCNLKSPFLIDYLFSNHSGLIKKIDLVKEKVADYAECENACATSNFYIVKELIEENPSPNLKEYYKLINTGTIEKYRDKWTDKEISYGGKYHFPVVKKEIFNKTLGKTYVRRAASKKIIFKGLNLLDGCLDEQANILPGKSTMVICNEDINKLKFLLGVLNSQLPIFYIKTKYASSSYCGGITFSNNMINCFPLFATKAQQDDIIKNVDKILLTKKRNPNADITFWEREINNIVYSLYNLTMDEIMIVEGK